MTNWTKQMQAHCKKKECEACNVKDMACFEFFKENNILFCEGVKE